MPQVTPVPTAMPPNATHRKLKAASWIEKAPVSAAAIAKRRQTRPEASLSRDSPSKMCIMRLGIGTRLAIAGTAIGSVGETTAAKANATDSGRSEERRVGKDGVSTCRSRWETDNRKKKKHYDQD